MPKVPPITKSPVTEYLLKNKFFTVKEETLPGTRHYTQFFYGENEDYLGEMMIQPKGWFDAEVHKIIFEEKLKPIFREYTRIKTKMASFWSKKNKEIDEYLPIAYTTTKVIIDLKNKTQTKKIIERVLENEPVLIQEVKEKYGTNVYDIDNQIFKYKIKSVTEETKPYKWNKYHKYNVFV
jgi:hypothetical protein